MNITRVKNIDDIVAKKEVYLAEDVDKNTLSIIENGFVPITLPPQDLGATLATGGNLEWNETVMEFALYDSSNNVLEQKRYGAKRYIRQNQINNYLIASDNPNDAVNNGGGWLVDVKTLIREAGFNTGYFRVQIDFVRNRVGSNLKGDKLWVQEISPTRQEVRLLPVDNFNANVQIGSDAEKIKTQLNLEYDSFINGEFPLDEVKSDVRRVCATMDITDIADKIEIKLGQELCQKIQREYGRSVRQLIGDLIGWFKENAPEPALAGADKFYQSSPSGEIQRFWSKDDVEKDIIRKFKNLLAGVFLPKRDLINRPSYTGILQDSLDALNEVNQKIQSDTTIGLPTIEREVITPKASPPPPEPSAPAPPPPAPSPTPIIAPPPSPIPPPIVAPKFISQPTWYATAPDTIVLAWVTDQNTDALVRFSINCPLYGCTRTYGEFVAVHTLTIGGMKPGTQYSVTVTATTKEGLKVDSNPLTFTTAGSATSATSITNPYSTTGGGGTSAPLTNTPTTMFYYNLLDCSTGYVAKKGYSAIGYNPMVKQTFKIQGVCYYIVNIITSGGSTAFSDFNLDLYEKFNDCSTCLTSNNQTGMTPTTTNTTSTQTSGESDGGMPSTSIYAGTTLTDAGDIRTGR